MSDTTVIGDSFEPDVLFRGGGTAQTGLRAVDFGTEAVSEARTSASTQSQAYTDAKRLCHVQATKVISQATGSNDDHCTSWLQFLADLSAVSTLSWKQHVLLYKEVRGMFLQLLKYLLRFNDAEIIENLLSDWESRYNRRLVPKAPLSAYNILLQAYVQRADIDKAVATVDRLRSVGHHAPNVYTYTNLITLYAYRRYPSAALKAFREISEAGLEPTQASYASLMNAYVESGYFDKALPIFEFLDRHTAAEHPLRPDIHTCTTLLKALVLMGSPFEEVSSFYKRLARRNIRPSSKTLALLLQSACDTENLDFAEEMFAKVDRGELQIKDPDFGSPINVYTFTIMIRGLLRAGQKDAARSYYDEMIRRGIEPSSATWSILIAAYSSDVQDGAACMIAEDLLNEFLRTYVSSDRTIRKGRLYAHDKALSRGTALHSAYGPMIASYARVVGQAARPVTGYASDSTYQAQLLTAVLSSKSPSQALVSFQSMLAHHQSTPSIPTYTALLDAYRRSGDVEGLKDIWRAVYAFAMQENRQGVVSATEAGSKPTTIRSNALCLALSVYIDAMSVAGQHDEVVSTWTQMQADGFGFDAANWNNLAVALIRANSLERALWITETVLLAPRDAPSERLLSGNAANGVLLTEAATGNAIANNVVHDSAPTFAAAHTTQELALETRAETPARPPNRASELHDKRRRRLQESEDDFALLNSDELDDAERDGQHELTEEMRASAATTAVADQYWLAHTRKYNRTWTVFNETIAELYDAIHRYRSGSDAGEQQPIAELEERYPLSIAEVDQRRRDVNKAASRTLIQRT